MTGPLVLGLDTATRQPVVALATFDGVLLGERSWISAHRHGEQLLSELDALLAESSVARHDLRGIVVGTGPGSFTGLRIGLATAKVLAYGLSLPLVGVPTTAALALAAGAGEADGTELAVVLAAGAADRYVCRYRIDGQTVFDVAPAALVAGSEQAAQAAAGAQVVAVGLEPPEVAAEAADRGHRALAGLGAALVGLGARRLAGGESDDVATLVPAYVALPRGIAIAAKEMTWSPDLR